MKQLVFVLPALLCLFSCEDQQMDKSQNIFTNKDQARLHEIVDEYFDNQYYRDNEIKKKEFFDSCVTKLDNYITDSLKGKMMNFSVHMKKVEYRPWGDNFALLMECEDGSIKYWMEQHFKTEQGMKGSGLYKAVAGFNQYKDTTLNFIYLPKAQIDKDKFLGYKASIEIVPVPDSIALKYRSKK